MGQEVQWLVGTALSLLIFIGGIAYAAFRAVGLRIDSAVRELRSAVSAGDSELHSRINRLREDVSDNYVRRIDLESHMKRTDEMLREMRNDQKELIGRMPARQPRPKRP